jgi:S-adenosylmethionine:tRNA ribosyltransferase-isomerase
VSLTRSDIWYDLPSDLIAQEPSAERSGSRLMIVRRAEGSIEHLRFTDLPGLLARDDLLVFNDTRVIPARLRGSRRGTGGASEVMLLERTGAAEWRVMLKPGRRCRPGIVIDFADGLEGTVVEGAGPSRAVVRFSSARGDLEGDLQRQGEVPLPPYIRRKPDAADRSRYQTVYAARDGAVAAPTAGLHFDSGILDRLEGSGIRQARLTLHVGPGTFEPLRHDTIDMNVLEGERYSYPSACSAEIARARAEGSRVAAVGTTSCRVLETVADEPGRPSEGTTSLFIRPPYVFRVVDALLTNFHLPGSSLLCLVAAFTGLENMQRAYREAVRMEYRFYSYGDAMLIL